MSSIIKEIAISLASDKSGANRKKWANYIVKNNVPLKPLIKLLYYEHPVSSYFSWMLGDLCEINPKFVQPIVEQLFKQKGKIKVPHFNRSIAKLMWLSGIPVSIEGEAVNELFRWLLDNNEDAAVKVYSMSALERLCEKYPEMKNELRVAIKNQQEKNTTTWFNVRAKRTLTNIL